MAVVAWRSGRTNGPLVKAWRRLGIRAQLLDPRRAATLLRQGDVAVVRLDVLQTLDGVEEGLDEMSALERRGVRLVNSPVALLAAHDKLETARRLGQAGLPQPRTTHVTRLVDLASVELPFVVKPRFGSWGWDVMRCTDDSELGRCLDIVRERGWFARHGALVQELLDCPGSDLRLLVAGGRVVGAAARQAAPGEWRTNVSLGGTPGPARPTAEACRLGVAAAQAIGGDFVGIDLLPTRDGDLVVLEVNGAADFLELYSLPGSNVFADAASALGLEPDAAEAA